MKNFKQRHSDFFNNAVQNFRKLSPVNRIFTAASMGVVGALVGYPFVMAFGPAFGAVSIAGSLAAATYSQIFLTAASNDKGPKKNLYNGKENLKNSAAMIAGFAIGAKAAIVAFPPPDKEEIEAMSNNLPQHHITIDLEN